MKSPVGLPAAAFRGRLASGYHGFGALAKHETTLPRGCCHDGKRSAGGNLPARPLIVRARADAGLVRQYQRETGRWRLAGDADQCLARLARPAAAATAFRWWAGW